MKLYLIHESVKIRHFDPGDEALSAVMDPWDIADRADRIADDSGIRISSDKELVLVAIIGGQTPQVVGAVWSSFTFDRDSGGFVYSLDVAVDRKMRLTGMTSTRIGPKLIDAALADYRDRAAQVDGRAYVRCWVVNPKLARYLEDRYGFEPEGRGGEWSQDAPHMTYQ